MVTGNIPFARAAEGTTAASREERRRKIAEAKAFIQHILVDGPHLAEVILKAAADAGIAEGTLYYAKRALRVTSRHQSYHGPWVWALPEHHQQPPDSSMRRHNVLLTKT